MADGELNQGAQGNVTLEDLDRQLDELIAFIGAVNNNPVPRQDDRPQLQRRARVNLPPLQPQPVQGQGQGQAQQHRQPQQPPDPYAREKAQVEAQWQVLEAEIRAAARVEPRSSAQEQLVKDFKVAAGTLTPVVDQARKDSSQYPAALRLLPGVRKKVAAVLAFGKTNERQGRYQGDLVVPLSQVKRNAFPVGGAKEIAKDKSLEIGSNFKPLLSAMGKLEAAKPKTLPLIEAVEKAANDYLESARGKKGGEEGKEHRAKKAAICYEALRNAKLLRLALEVDRLGMPPWSPEREGVAMQARAVSIFESGGHARPLPPGEAGTSGSWFVDAKVALPGHSVAQEGTKSRFIFKPADTEDTYEKGWVPNGGAVREVAAKAMSDHVLSATGVDLGISPTSLISISNDQLPDQHGQVDDNLPPQRVGAMQELAPNDGTLTKMHGKLDPNAQGYDANAAQQIRQDLANLPTAELGKVVWADFLTINHDRHPGNVLIDRANNKLVPIDHGKSMPPSLDVAVKYRGERRAKCALIQLADQGLLPQIDQKLPDDMVAKIDLHDPAAMAQKVKGQRDALKGPGHSDAEKAMADKLSDEAIDLSARSALFFKAASKELTLRQLLKAQSDYLHAVLAADPGNVDAVIRDVIAKVQANSRAETALIQRFPGLPGDQSQLKAVTTPLGWSWIPNKDDDLFATNPDFLLKVVTNGLVEPKLQARIDELTAELNRRGVALPPNLGTLNPEARKDRLQQLLSADDDAKVRNRAQQMGLPPDDVNAQAQAKADLECEATLSAAGINPGGMSPQAKAKKAEEVLLAEYNRLGGDPELEKAKPYGLIPAKTAALRLKLNALKAWIEYRNTALPKRVYQVGLAPSTTLPILNNLQVFKAAVASEQLDRAH